MKQKDEDDSRVPLKDDCHVGNKLLDNDDEEDDDGDGSVNIIYNKRRKGDMLHLKSPEFLSILT